MSTDGWMTMTEQTSAAAYPPGVDDRQRTIPPEFLIPLPCPVCGGQVVKRSREDGGPYCVEGLHHLNGLVLRDEPVARRLCDDVQTLAAIWPELWAVPWGGLARCLEAMGWRNDS